METLPSWVAVAGLFALRLGVPIAVTLAIGYLLSQLDRRWQAEQLDQQAQARAAGKQAARTPCWERMGCDPAKREKCPAYAAKALPCWIARRRAEGRIPEPCFGCPVFAQAVV